MKIIDSNRNKLAYKQITETLDVISHCKHLTF